MHIRYVTTKGLSYDFFLNMYYTILHLFIFNVCTKMLLYSLVIWVPFTMFYHI